MFIPPGHDQSRKPAGGKRAPDDSAREGAGATEHDAAPARNPVWQSLATRPSAIQPKLTVGQANDPFEREADQIADQVMGLVTLPSSDSKLSFTSGSDGKARRKCGTCEEGAEEELRRKEHGGHADSPATVPSIVHQTLSSQGQPLDRNTRAFMESGFGQDFSQVRVHANARAAESAKAINARAFTVGRDIVFGEGQYAAETVEGKRLLAHELAHVAQQTSETVIRRDPPPPATPPAAPPADAPPAAPPAAAPAADAAKMTRLRELLDDDDEEDAITLMGQLNETEVQQVLASREYKELAISAFDNEEMYRGVRAMRGDLYTSLEWMFDEGTDWTSVRDVVSRARLGKDRVRVDNWMKQQFVSLCDDDEMAEAVDLLGGTLLEKLPWMEAEGLGWDMVRAKIVATTDPNEKQALYDNNDVRAYFVDICNDREMTEAVGLLGGTLLQKLGWMWAEETSAEYVYGVIRVAPQTELQPVLENQPLMDGLLSWLGEDDYQRVRQMLSQGLLHWEEESHSYTEEHYEQESPTDPWELESFGKTAKYEIRYTRSELRIIVRIELTGVTAPAALQQTWITGIQNSWNNQFHIENSRRLAVVFDPIFTSTDSHNTIKVHDVPATGTPRADAANFYTNTTGATAAHEFGHLVGLEDEYNLTAADYQRLSGTPAPAGPMPPGGYTIPGLMGTATGNVQGRHLAPFLRWLNSHRLAGERPYRLVAGP